MTSSREKLGLALGFAGVVMFGGTLPMTRLAVSAFDPLFLTATRVTIAGCVGAAFLLTTRRSWPTWTQWRLLALTGLCTIVGFPVLMAFAMTLVPAAHGGVVLGILPLATMAAATIVTHERPSAGFWLVSAVGAAIVIAFMLRHGAGGGIGLGDLLLLGTVVAGGFGYSLSGRLSQTMPGWEVISWQVALYLLPAAVAMAALWPGGLASVPWPAWGGLAYVALISQFFAFFLFNAGLAMGGIARVGQLSLLQPFVIVALAWPVDGEPIELSTLGYAAAVVL
ncbi:MAG TPA: DMT family transporter, partial [Pseudolabrys sp.]|nr:DMT family transporter [Pseudolabrys sp.]